MPESEYEAQHSGLKLNDFLFILFRHKWKILLFSTAGIAAAAEVYVSSQTLESKAKLLVRYVVERSAIDRLDSAIAKPGSENENLLNSEVEILTSWDLATQIAQAIGPERLLPGLEGKATVAGAAGSILGGLKVAPLRDSNIISVSYQNRDPVLAVRVLQELVSRYFDKHLEVHRSGGAFNLVKEEADQVQGQLNEAEAKLKELKAKVGITSLAEGTANLNAELTKGQEELDAAEAELAGQEARVKGIEKWLATTDKSESESAMRQARSKAVREYEDLVTRLGYLRQSETDLTAKFTSENQMVRIKQGQIDGLEKQRQQLEEKFPGIAAVLQTTGFSQSSPDLVSEKSHLAEIEARAQTLRSRLRTLQERSKMLLELGPQIGELERRKELEETNYRYFEASLEKARVDETLDPSRMPNISVVQKPSPANPAIGDVKKIVLGLAGGGFAVGIAIALLSELVLDRTIKRPLELENRLSIPLLLSIPHFGRNGQLRLNLSNEDNDSEALGQESTRHEIAPWDDDHSIQPFCEAIRDRLAFFFEVNRMTHKPKLVAVAGLSRGAGASTLAAGIAATLSKGGNDKVVLVDEPLDPKRFYDLISEFKASDFDYVIFDMPPLSDTTPTLAMAGFVDKVLLVVESAKSSREVVKRAYGQLIAANAKVSVIFNKSRSYGPKWLGTEA